MKEKEQAPARNVPDKEKKPAGQKFGRSLQVSLLSPVIGAVALLFAPLCNFDGSGLQVAASMLVPTLVWGSVITEIVMTLRCQHFRKEMELTLFKSKAIHGSYPGVISFAKNREGVIADIVLFVSAIVVALTLQLHVETAWIVLSCVFLFFLSFNMHCLLNGKNYRYYKAYKKRGAKRNA